MQSLAHLGQSCIFPACIDVINPNTRQECYPELCGRGDARLRGTASAAMPLPDGGFHRHCSQGTAQSHTLLRITLTLPWTLIILLKVAPEICIDMYMMVVSDTNELVQTFERAIGLRLR